MYKTSEPTPDIKRNLIKENKSEKANALFENIRMKNGQTKINEISISVAISKTKSRVDDGYQILYVP